MPGQARRLGSVIWFDIQEGKTMDAFERTLYETDFSQYTDLKTRLAAKLFGSKKEERTTRFTFNHITDDEAEFVNAAQGLPTDKKPFDPVDPLK